MKRCIGIDLGTSTSEVAVLKDGQPVIIPNDKGERVIPSVVFFGEENQVKVGNDARSYAVLEPENTVIEVKRLMGSGQVVRCRNKRMSPSEVSAHILGYLKQCAEEFLGEEVDEAVITVPAYFTNEQRVATREAGELAGFRVERIINEPTAAALAYGIDHIQEQGIVLVYDLGGGTLDVTVLEIFMGVLDVKASSGNNALGGKDFDEAVINRIADRFLKKHGLDLRYDKKAMWRLKEAVEHAKIQLSDAKSAKIDLPLIATSEGKSLGLHHNLLRTEFEEVILEMVKSTFLSVDKALSDANLTPADVHTILLIGGSTRIPLVRRLIAEKFGKEPRFEVNPEEAVALGAAIQSGIKRGELPDDRNLIVTDVCPYTLGVEVSRELGGMSIPGFFDPLIKRNTTIPVTVKKEYCTVHENQHAVRIRAYQGDAQFVCDNCFIGSFLLENIPQAPAGAEEIDISFTYDVNGILEVKAVSVSTGNSRDITVDTRKIEPNKAEKVNIEWKNSRFARKVKSLIRHAEQLLSDTKIDQPKKEEIGYVLYDLKTALSREDELSVKRFEDELTELIYGINEEV